MDASKSNPWAVSKFPSFSFIDTFKFLKRVFKIVQAVEAPKSIIYPKVESHFFFVSEAIRWSVIRVLNWSIYSNPMILPLCYWHNYLVVGLRVKQFTRRNHSAESNALLVELIERLGSVKFVNRTQSQSHQKILAIEPSRTLIEFDTVRWSKFSIRLKVGRYTAKLTDLLLVRL